MKYLIFVLLTVSCQVTKHSLISQQTIEGDWCLIKKNNINEINYGQIYFDSNGVITLFSRADTLYSYKYKIDQKNLLIIRYANNDTIRSHILKLTTDSLILSSLIEKEGLQVYYRCDKKIKQ